MDGGSFVEQGRKLATKGSMLGLMLISQACAKPPSDFGPSLTRTREIVHQLDPAQPVPTDVLEGQFRTFIHNLPDIQLQVMPEALVADPVFRQVMEAGDEELHIVLMDGSYVDEKFLPPDLPEEDRSEISKAFDEGKIVSIMEAIQSYASKRESQLKWYKAELENIDKAHAAGKYTEEEVAEMKTLLKLYHRPYTDDLVDEDVIGDTAGKHVFLKKSMLPLGEDARSQSRRYIFLAVRQPSRPLAFDKYLDIRFSLGSDEKSRLPPDWDLNINPGQSLRDPKSIKFDHTNNKYPISELDLGIALRHELGHAKGIGHPKTDFNVLSEFRKAWERYHTGEAWEKGEKGDTSGYYFKFVTPAGDIYSQNPSVPERPSVAARAHAIKGHTTADFRARAKARLRT